MHLRAIAAVLLLAFLAASESVHAQVITGNLVGTARDESGGLLPGAAVTLTSPDLIGGPSVRVTNEKGQFRFPNLAPGAYELKVSLSGLADYREEGIRIEVGGTVERDVILKLAGVAEAVFVSGESPLVDTHKAGMSTNYSTESLEKIPTRRFSVFDLMKSSPGVSATRPSGLSDAISVFGSGINENAFLLDGTSITTPGSGTVWPWPDPDVMEEIEIVSLGASAEYGNIQGGVFNVVTKQGGNDFRFDASYYGQAQSLTSQPIKLDCNCPEGESGYTRDLFRDFSTHVGGPVLKDRLWFFGGYQHQRDYDSQPGADPRFPRKFEVDRIFWKITWQITPRLKLMHSFHEDFWAYPGVPSISRPYETTTTNAGQTPTSTFARLTHILSDSTFWEARVSGFQGPGDLTPNSGSLTLSGRYDIATGMYSGGAPQFGTGDQDIYSVQAKLSHYAADFLASDHDFKFGVQFLWGSGRFFWAYPGSAFYFDYAGEPYFAYLREPYSYGAELRNPGAFAEDVVRIGERVTLNLGVRFDRNHAISSDIPELDAVGNETGGTIAGLGTLYTWNVLSPRLGLNVKITTDGRTVLRTSYGRFYQGVIGNEIVSVHPGLTPITLAFFDPRTGEYSYIVGVIDPLENVRIDPETKPPHTDQFSIGLDRELTNNLALGVTYVRKDGRDFTGWEDVGGVYGSDTTTLPDGRTLTVYPLVNSPSERLFVLTNPEGYFLRYNGLLLTLEKRWSNRWQALVSYSLSEAVGLQSSSGFGAGLNQNSSTAGWNPFGQDPNNLTNATGNLPNDRTHMFRVQGSVEIPKVSVLVAAHYQYLTGTPWAGYANVRLPQGALPIFVEPRGSQRLSSQSLLDLRVSKMFHFRESGKVELLVDILNLLNEAAEERVITGNVFSPSFGEGRMFVEPRRAMIGLKLAF